jgi:hypothetical protein
LQRWQGMPGAFLYNAGAHRCLSDPANGHAGELPGVVLTTASRASRQGDGWFKP